MRKFKVKVNGKEYEVEIEEIKTEEAMSTETVSQFKKWIQVRLQVENVEVQNTVIE